MNKSSHLPLLPLRDIVVFPNMVAPLFVGRDKSIKALNEVMNTDKKIVLVTQKNSEIDDPTEDDIYSYGCEGKILQLLKLPDGTVKVLIEGTERVKIIEFQDNKNFLVCKTEIVKEKIDSKEELLVLALAIVRKLEKLVNLNKKISSESITSLKELRDPSKIADNIAIHLNLSINEKQKLLEFFDLRKKLEKIMQHIDGEISVLSMEKRNRGREKNKMQKTQRQYYLVKKL